MDRSMYVISDHLINTAYKMLLNRANVSENGHIIKNSKKTVYSSKKMRYSYNYVTLI